MLYLNIYLDFFHLILNLYISLSLFISLMVIYAANAVYAVLFLIGTFLLVGCIFIVLGAEYLGLVLMIIYIGAIAILFLFILMLLDLKNLIKQRVRALDFGIFGLTIFITVEAFNWIAQFGPAPFFVNLSPLSFLLNTKLSPYFIDSISVLSPILYNAYFYYVIGCGFVLLFVMLGVVVLLAESAFPFNEQPYRGNKYLIEHQKVVQNASLK